MLQRFEHRMRNMLVDTPLNQKYIGQTALKRALIGTTAYAQGKLLDVGCGEKQYRYLFIGKIDKYIGIDLPSCYLEGAKIDVFGDAHNLPFKSKLFDTILCTQMLHHIKNPKRIFKEFERVLKGNCHVIVTAPKSYPKMRSGPDYFRFTDDGLRYLAEASGLKVLYVKPTCGMLATIGQYFSRYLYGNFVVSKKTKRPNMWLYPLVLPFCAVVQKLFSVLDKITNWDTLETDTLDYVMVAKKGS